MRPKYLLHYGPFQLRIEQVASFGWHCSVGREVFTRRAGKVIEKYNWLLRSICSSEKAAKEMALAEARHLSKPRDYEYGEWEDCSDETDDQWASHLVKRGFPGYASRKNLEWFPGLRERFKR